MHPVAPVSNAVGESKDTLLTVLGLLSCIFGPLTGIPGIVIARRCPPKLLRGKIGHALCWITLTLFALCAVTMVYRVINR